MLRAPQSNLRLAAPRIFKLLPVVAKSRNAPLVWKRHRPSALTPSEGTAVTAEAEEAEETVYDLQDNLVAERWTDFFANNWDGLFDADLQQLAELGVMEDIEADGTPADVFPPAVATSLIGMGTWRLAGTLRPTLEYMVCKIEGTWRELFYMDLALYDEEKWKGPGWHFVDSLDPTREWDGWAHVDVPDPEKGEPGYPRLLLENRVYCTNTFRKMHIEVARRQDDLQVLHVVMYPNYHCDLPIFALDMVAGRDGIVTLAVVDACPVRKNKMLNPRYLEVMSLLQQKHLPDMVQGRAVPDWGKEIFSPLCVCITPKDGEELAGFMRYALSLHRAHCMLGAMVRPLSATDPPALERRREILVMHKRFVDFQLQNKKTSRVLDAAFGQEFTRAYMSEMMFDFDPSDISSVEDESFNLLYQYYMEQPQMSQAQKDWLKMRKEVDLAEAQKVLKYVLNQEQPLLNQTKLEWALEAMYKHDADFQRQVMVQYPDGMSEELLDSGELGGQLAADMHLLDMVAPKWTHN